MRGLFIPLFVTAVLSFVQFCSGQDRLVAHWRLAGSAENSTQASLHGKPENVVFQKGSKPAQFATFNGRDSQISVPADQAIQLGTNDFTVAVWINAGEGLDDDPGDLISQFDPKSRTGFHLSLRNNAGVTHSQANNRQLQFGYDAGTEPSLIDEGQPGAAIFGQSMAVHQGSLYVGTCESGSKQAGHVYRYEGPRQWTDLGAPDVCNSITGMASYGGHLYVGSGKYRLRGSSLDESENPNFGGRLYRYSPSGKWMEVAQFPGMEAVGGIVGFRGKLYVSSLYAPAAFYCLEMNENRVTSLNPPNGKRVEALGVFNGFLWATGYDEGHVYRFDGTQWEDLGQVGEAENTQTYAFATHLGKLQVATWRTGKVFEWDSKNWLDRGRLGEELEVMGMLVHNGCLYGGTLPLAQLYRYGGGTDWTLIKQLDTTPDVKYRRVWTMAQYRGRLFATTLPSGHIWSMQAGACTTWDDEFPMGWHHVAAQRDGKTLRLFVDGKMVSSSEFDGSGPLNLNSDKPWKIGAGSGDYFQGSMSDLRVYRSALSAAEIRQLAQSN